MVRRHDDDLLDDLRSRLPPDQRARIEALQRQSSQDNMARLHEDLRDRYTNEEIKTICSGANWEDVRGVAVNATSVVCRSLGVPEGLIHMVEISMVARSLSTLAFLLGYEKRAGEEQSKELGLGGESDGN